MHRLLHLQKHHHTGKFISHRHTSYRSLFVVVALFSLVLAGIQQSVGADEMVISAKVAAPIPTQPAVIQSPTHATMTDSPVITVNGTCQIMDPAIIIAITSAGQTLGSTTCTNSGTFSLPVTLQPGENHLVARSVNITDDYGPDGVSLLVTYTPPSAGVPSTIADGATPTNDAPIAGEGNAIAKLNILSKYTYITYGPDKPATWIGSFEGGVQPYFVSIDWGDGLSTTLRNVDGSEQSVEHRYKIYATYFITVTVTDKDGRSLQQQLAAVTPYVPQAGVAVTADDSSTPPIIDSRILTVGIYASVAVLTGLGALAFTSVHTVATVAGPHSHFTSRKAVHQAVRKRR